MKSVDIAKWSGEGTFTQVLLDRLSQIESIAFHPRRGCAGQPL